MTLTEENEETYYLFHEQQTCELKTSFLYRGFALSSKTKTIFWNPGKSRFLRTKTYTQCSTSNVKNNYFCNSPSTFTNLYRKF
jgi:hypothetical protein